MANYNKDTDYQALINQAVANGNYSAAAQYEQQRNAKIADLDAAGTNTYGAKATNQYSQYLNGGGDMLTPDTGFSGSSNNVYTFNNTQAGIQDQMNKNSQLWWDAYNSGNSDLMKTLEQANKTLAAQLGSGVTFDSHTGYWSGLADQPVQLQTGVDVQMPTWDGTTAVAPTWSGVDTAKPTYQSQYNAQIDALINQILNRGEFSYDAESDPIYQQYKKQYNREGNRAMNDTLASAAINAGGMNSYAMTAAQQANDYYSAQLADKIPELYQLAYSMWQDDLANQRADLGMLQDQEGLMYDRYRDEVGDWYTDRDFSYGQYRDEMSDYHNNRDFEYGVHRDNVADSKWSTEFNYGVERDQIADQRYDQEWQYGVSRDQLADSRYDNETAYERAMDMLLQGIMPSSDLLAKAGISSAEAAAMKQANLPTVKYSGGGGGGSSGGSSGGGGSYGGGGSSGGSDEVDVDLSGIEPMVRGMTLAQLRAKVSNGNLSRDDIAGMQSEISTKFGSDVFNDLVAVAPLEAEEELTLDMSSVSNLGYGMISEKQLADLVAKGYVETYVSGNKIKVRLTDKGRNAGASAMMPSATETMIGNMLDRFNSK